MARRVIDQSVRRILDAEQVPAEEKVVSIFEPHTDIIKKGQREIIYGHKIFLSAGKSNLILDCAIGALASKESSPPSNAPSDSIDVHGAATNRSRPKSTSPCSPSTCKPSRDIYSDNFAHRSPSTRCHRCVHNRCKPGKTSPKHYPTRRRR